jgi:hypothetical protein
MSDYYDIHGMPVSKGQPIPLRQEFSVWAKEADTNIQFSLFIRALQSFYAISYEDKLSYFQIAGL